MELHNVFKQSIFCAFLSLFLVLGPGSALGGEIYKKPPKVPDTSARYVFYMHGAWLEEHSEGERDRRYGLYRYTDILNALADKGFVVVSEKRAGRTNPKEYVPKIAKRVRKLIKKGVPPSHITVSGFSRGGAMTLEVAMMLQNPNVNFVVLSGCGIGNYAKGYQRFLKRGAGRMAGRMLSIYDSRDTDGGTCTEAFSNAGLSEAKEIVLKVGSGHAVFFQPQAEWIDPMVAWAKGP